MAQQELYRGEEAPHPDHLDQPGGLREQIKDMFDRSDRVAHAIMYYYLMTGDTRRDPITWELPSLSEEEQARVDRAGEVVEAVRERSWRADYYGHNMAPVFPFAEELLAQAAAAQAPSVVPNMDRLPVAPVSPAPIGADRAALTGAGVPGVA